MAADFFLEMLKSTAFPGKSNLMVSVPGMENRGLQHADTQDRGAYSESLILLVGHVSLFTFQTSRSCHPSFS